MVRPVPVLLHESPATSVLRTIDNRRHLRFPATSDSLRRLHRAAAQPPPPHKRAPTIAAYLPHAATPHAFTHSNLHLRLWPGEQRPPNILWIFGDQHRAQSLSLAGDPNLQTPNIDRLGTEGLFFRQEPLPTTPGAARLDSC